MRSFTLVRDRLPTYALMTVPMNGPYQSQIWRGATSAARFLGVRLVAYVGNYFYKAEKNLNRPDLSDNGSPLFQLAGATDIDGYLPVVGSLGNFDGTDMIQRFLDQLPPKPIVCLGVALPGRISVVPSGSGIDKAVDHLVQVHGCRDIFYIGGTPHNFDAQYRLANFKQAMRENGLEPNAEDILVGDFSSETAEQLVEGLLDQGRIPQAIVCANDSTAIGAATILQRRGYRVPEDVILTGFDDSDEAKSMKPSLTTVAASAYQIAFRSMELLHDQHLGKIVQSETLPTQFIVRRSCGCRAVGSSVLLANPLGLPQIPDLSRFASSASSPPEALAFQERIEKVFDHASDMELDLWEEKIVVASRQATAPDISRYLLEVLPALNAVRQGHQISETMSLQRQMSGQFQAIRSIMSDLSQEGFVQRLLTGLRSNVNSQMRILLFRKDLEPEPHPKFEPGKFQLELDVESGYIGPPRDPSLPHQVVQEVWCVLPLILGDDTFGVLQIREWTAHEMLLEGLRQTLTFVLSAAHNAYHEAQVREEFKRLAIRDQMTGLLNRRGLLEQGELLGKLALRDQNVLGIAMFDLDGLKEINDRFGHKDGDLAIQLLGQSLVDGFRQVDVIGRLGGDEFAVVAKMTKEGSLDGALARVRQSLTQRSIQLDRLWQARTSGGWILWDPKEGTDLDLALSLADKNLYKDKQERKSRRKSP